MDEAMLTIMAAFAQLERDTMIGTKPKTVDLVLVRNTAGAVFLLA